MRMKAKNSKNWIRLRQKLDELSEYAVEIQADIDKDTFKTFMAWLALTYVQPLITNTSRGHLFWISILECGMPMDIHYILEQPQ